MTATARPLEQLQFRLFRPVPVVAPQIVETPEPSPLRDDVRQLRETLQATVAAKVTSATELLRALDRTRREETIPTTLDAFDALLGGGLPRGKMVELTGRRAAGRFSTVLAALAAATSMGEAAVLVDLGDHLDPQLAEENGVDLRRLLWIRPKTLKQAVMSTEMIAATGFQLVVLDVGLHPIRSRRVPDASWVRLARTAEANGTALLVSTPYPLTGTASEAVVTAERSRTQWLGRGKAPRLLASITTDLMLMKHRHRKPGAQGSVTFAAQDAPASVATKNDGTNRTDRTETRVAYLPALPAAAAGGAR
ncbi:MAG TPA: hypothetical protein VF618_09570 [Thermoanaerobaculia bacterium]